MAGWKQSLSRKIRGSVYRVERGFDRMKHGIKKTFGWVEPVQIMPYHGFGTQKTLMLKGRVLEDKQLGGPREDDSWWTNLRNMYRRFDSDEIPNVRVKATYHGETQETVTNEEGYFEIQFHPETPPNPETLWHDVQLELMDEIVPGQTEVLARGEVLVPPADAQFGVISDMDDTVLKTHATSLWRMAKLTFLRNARTRMPFEGVAAFYRALQRGPHGTHHNPVFYVSSSAWNLYDLLVDFLELNQIPKGPLMLRDLGTGKNTFRQGGHGHKLEKIERLLRTYPDLPFVLIGDSGQEDPKIYRQAVLDFPGRIKAVYIRDVVANHREGVEEIAEELKAHNVEMLLVEDTHAAAIHAVKLGLISETDLEEIRRETRIDKDDNPSDKPTDERLAPV